MFRNFLLSCHFTETPPFSDTNIQIRAHILVTKEWSNPTPQPCNTRLFQPQPCNARLIHPQPCNARPVQPQPCNARLVHPQPCNARLVSSTLNLKHIKLIIIMVKVKYYYKWAGGWALYRNGARIEVSRMKLYSRSSTVTLVTCQSISR